MITIPGRGTCVEGTIQNNMFHNFNLGLGWTKLLSLVEPMPHVAFSMVSLSFSHILGKHDILTIKHDKLTTLVSLQTNLGPVYRYHILCTVARILPTTLFVNGFIHCVL